MIEIKNTYEDRDVFVTTRDVATGSDGTTTTLATGETYAAEVDGEHQVSIATRGRNPGELPLDNPAARLIQGDGPASAAVTAQPTLADASDDQVRAAIQGMIDSKTDLTAAGEPNLGVLNAKLAEQGFGPVDGARRTSLMPQPA